MLKKLKLLFRKTDTFVYSLYQSFKWLWQHKNEQKNKQRHTIYNITETDRKHRKNTRQAI